MARIPGINTLMDMMGVGSDARYRQLEEALKGLEAYPETQVRRGVPGYYGTIQESFSSHLHKEAMADGVAYGPAPTWQHREADQRTKALPKIIRIYTDAREQGMSHNDALDIMYEVLSKAKDSASQRAARSIRRHYDGNRSGPLE